MTAAPVEEMKRLCDELAQDHADIKTRVTAFPSGSVMLDVCREGRAFVMAYAPATGFAVDELRPNDGIGNNYRFNFRDFESAATKLKALADAKPNDAAPAISLLVLQARDVELTKEFYTTLGLRFVAEQHGLGPSHYAANVGSLVFEIYPCRTGSPVPPLRVGFRVPSLQSTVDALRVLGTKILSEPKDSAWGRRAVVEDPDGNRVELSPMV